MIIIASMKIMRIPKQSRTNLPIPRKINEKATNSTNNQRKVHQLHEQITKIPPIPQTINDNSRKYYQIQEKPWKIQKVQ